MTDMILSDGKQLSMQDYITDIIATNGKTLPKTLEEFKPQFEKVKVLARTTIAFALASSSVETVSDTQKANTEAAQSLSIADIIMTQHLGKLTEKIPKVPDGVRRGSRREGEYPEKSTALSANGLTQKQASTAERMSRNPTIVNKVIEDAKRKGEIPSKRRIIAEIKQKEATERAQQKEVNTRRKAVKKDDRAVKNYFIAVKGYKEALRKAITAAELGKFASEASGKIQTTNDELKLLMYELEALV